MFEFFNFLFFIENTTSDVPGMQYAEPTVLVNSWQGKAKHLRYLLAWD